MNSDGTKVSEIVVAAPSRRRNVGEMSAARKRPQVTLIMKATRLCNLRCTYCNAWREGPNQVMPMEIVERTTREAMQLPGVRNVEFVWHGGETTLLKPDYFYRALELQEKYRGSRVVSNAVQTNATRLNDRWISLFKQGEFSVGVSIDPPPERHARERPTKGGRDSWKATLDGVRMLEAAGINHGFLVVVNDELIEYGPQRFLACLEEHGLKSIALLNVIPDNRDPARKAENYLAWNRYVRFLIDVYLAKKGQYPHIKIREVDALFGSITQGVPSICIYAGDCMGQYVTVEPNGEIKACDKYVYDRSYLFGDVSGASLVDILSGPGVTATREQYFKELQPFKACQYFDYCKGGCPHDQYLLRLVDPGAQLQCCGLAPLVEVMLKDVPERRATVA